MARIASVAFTHYDSDPRVRRMATSLADRGDEVVAVVLRRDDQPRVRVVDGVEVVGIRIRRYRGDSTLSYVAQYLAFFFAATWVLTRLHLRRRFDLVHANNMPDFIVFAALPAKLTGAAVVLDIHDPMPELYESKFGSGPDNPLVRLVSWVERVSVRFADKVISVHDVQRDTLLSRGSPLEKVTIVQNVADERYFPRGAALDSAEMDPVTVVYHGLIARRLGLDVAIRAMAKVRAETDAVRLLLIGDGDASGDIRSLIDDLDLPPTVEFQHGFIGVESLLSPLSRSQIGIVPARIDPFTRNMLPTKLVEYVTLGIPVICTDLPPVRRYFTDEQIVMIPDDDPDALAAAIVDLARDPVKRQRLAARALRYVEEHGWDKQRQRYWSLVDSLVEAR